MGCISLRKKKPTKYFTFINLNTTRSCTPWQGPGLGASVPSAPQRARLCWCRHLPARRWLFGGCSQRWGRGTRAVQDAANCLSSRVGRSQPQRPPHCRFVHLHGWSLFEVLLLVDDMGPPRPCNLHLYLFTGVRVVLISVSIESFVYTFHPR